MVSHSRGQHSCGRRWLRILHYSCQQSLSNSIRKIDLALGLLGCRRTGQDDRRRRTLPISELREPEVPLVGPAQLPNVIEGSGATSTEDDQSVFSDEGPSHATAS